MHSSKTGLQIKYLNYAVYEVLKSEDSLRFIYYGQKTFWTALCCFLCHTHSQTAGRKADDKHIHLASEGESAGGMRTNIEICNHVAACSEFNPFSFGWAFCFVLWGGYFKFK